MKKVMMPQKPEDLKLLVKCLNAVNKKLGVVSIPKATEAELMAWMDGNHE